MLGFQGRSQLEARYVLDAEAMLSQPATKVFLRTSEPKSAKWISEAIGQVKLEFVHETRTDGRERNSRSYHKETAPKPLVTPPDPSDAVAPLITRMSCYEISFTHTAL